jgi:hypothetical protein
VAEIVGKPHERQNKFAAADNLFLSVMAFERCKQETSARDRFEGMLISALRDC